MPRMLDDPDLKLLV